MGHTSVEVPSVVDDEWKDEASGGAEREAVPWRRGWGAQKGECVARPTVPVARRRRGKAARGMRGRVSSMQICLLLPRQGFCTPTESTGMKLSVLVEPTTNSLTTIPSRVRLTDLISVSTLR